MTKHTLMLSLALLLTTVGQAVWAAAQKPIRLAGTWRFRLDRADAGVTERWFERVLPDRIRLPGGLSEQGVGDPVTADTKWIGGIVDKSWFTAPEFAAYRQPDNVKIPFWPFSPFFMVGTLQELWCL